MPFYTPPVALDLHVTVYMFTTAFIPHFQTKIWVDINDFNQTLYMLEKSVWFY